MATAAQKLIRDRVNHILTVQRYRGATLADFDDWPPGSNAPGFAEALMAKPKQPRTNTTTISRRMCLPPS